MFKIVYQLTYSIGQIFYFVSNDFLKKRKGKKKYLVNIIIMQECFFYITAPIITIRCQIPVSARGVAMGVAFP